MIIGIIGLGLIGGSIAKAIKLHTDHTVLGYDLSPTVIYKAKLVEAIDAPLGEGDLARCDLVFIAIYPGDTVRFIQDNAHKFKPGAIVLDACGVKRQVCEPLKDVAADANFVFIGAHPMAGREFSGFEYSKENLFASASMILTPYSRTPIATVDWVKKFCLQIGFGTVVVTSDDDHDHLIAYTSQLAHVVSNAYVKSPSSRRHKGFSAGSYRDLTRVARLNEDMWNELFLLNSDYLVAEIDGLINHLAQYRKALAEGDGDTLRQLLREGREIKELVDQPEEE